MDSPARLTAESVARRSYGKLVALLAARTGDMAAAEDALADGFAAALTDWPRHGCPANPEAWLLTVARRKLIDAGRKQRLGERLAAQQRQAVTAALDSPALPDQRLALLFACAHPDVEPAIRAPLMLQVVLGLDAKAIASAFLTSPSAMGKRLVRAKERIRQTGAAFHIPVREELPARLGSVLEAIYAAYSEGWTDPGGSDLTAEALYLAGLAAALLPEEPEALALFALLLHTEARRNARRNAEGEYVPLAEQDPATWDADMIREAEALLRRACASGRAIGRYQLEGALQSAHMHRRRHGAGNEPEIVQLYDALFDLAASPVVAINRALAIGACHGPAAGLAALPEPDARLAEYQPYWAARADLLAQAGAHREAAGAYEIAIGLERDPAVRRFLQRRQAVLG